ncbi:hypothetical protein Aduo_013827 [Ancylostoma duodenale]
MENSASTVSSSSSSFMVPADWEIQERVPMNQDEFDRRYEYTRPAQENLLVAATTKYLAKFIRPCSSFSSFSRTILAFLPILQWVPRYDVKENLLRDVIGGFMVGIMHVPQGIAYALLAGVHPVVGLYTSFFPVIAYMLFGTSRHASIGSFAVVALMTGQTVHRLSRPVVVNVTQTIGDPTEVQYEPVEIASALTLTIGLIQIIVGLVGLDFVTTYFSEQLVAGFTTGASVHVFVTQLKDITGIYGTPRRAGVGNAILRTSDIIVEISRINWTAAAVSAVTMLILITGKKIVNPIVQRRSPVPVPFELLVVILGTIFSAILSLETKYHVAVVGHIPTGLPLPSVPRVEILPHLLKDAISISVVIMAVHISMAKLLAKKYRYPIDTKQEFFAIGLTSTISSFFPVFPSSCSLARTLVNASAGTRTQLFAVFSSLFIFSVVQFSGSWLRTLPMCILASIIIVALLDMFVKFQQIPKIWAISKVDCAIWIVAFLATACVDVMDGLAIAIIFALLTTVFRLQWPHWHILANVTGTMEYKDVERYRHVNFVKGICIVRFDAPLLFTNVEHFRAMTENVSKHWNNVECNSPTTEESSATEDEEVVDKYRRPSCTRPRKFLIVDCSGFVYVDMMGVNCLKEIYEELIIRGIRVFFAAPKAPVRELFEAAGLYNSVKKSNFYPTVHDAMFFAQHRRSLATLAWMRSNESSYDTVVLSDDSTQSDSPVDRKLSWYHPVYSAL